MASKSKVSPTEKLRTFEIDEFFFSITDHAGVIKVCNKAFCRNSGFEPHETLGSPHNIIRHPDMPSAVFKRVWGLLKDGKPAGAYIKNLAKTGEFYWVYAVIVPAESGYLSIRFKPTSELLPKVQALYARARELERALPDDQEEGMQRAGKLIEAGVRDMGFESYQDFMVQALNREVECRQAEAEGEARAARTTSHRTGDVKRLFELRQSLSSISDFFDELAVQIRRVAINASIVAARLEDKGSALGVISEEVSNVAAQLTEETGHLREQVEDLRQQLFATSFNTSYRGLLRGTRDDFEDSKQDSSQSLDEQRMSYGSSIDEICATLDRCYADAKKSQARSREGLQRSLKRFDRFIDALARILMTLQLGYVTGKSVSVAIDGGQEFSILLEDLAGYYSAAQTELKNTRERVRGVPSSTPPRMTKLAVATASTVDAGGPGALRHGAA